MNPDSESGLRITARFGHRIMWRGLGGVRMFPALTRRITQHFRKLSLTVVAFDLGGEFYIFGHTIQWVLSVWATPVVLW